MSGILVYALHYDGAINKNSLGAVSEGARLAGELGTECHAIVIGEGVSDELASQLGNYGASKVYRVEGPEGLAQPVVDAMAKVIQDNGHGYALFGGGLLGFEVGAGLAARLGAGVAMEVTAVRAEGPEGLAQPVIDAMAKVIGDGGHGYALFGGGLLGFEIGAGLAARLDAGVCMEVTNVRVEDGKLVA